MAPAYAQVYKCVDGDGRVTYTNAKAAGANCGPLRGDLPVSSIPSGDVPASRSSGGQSVKGDSASFPKVSEDAQKARDEDRRKILADELAKEEAAMAAAKTALAEQEAVRLGNERNYQKVLDRLQPFKDKVELHERNIEALKKEIAGLK
jgi:hypothetical protein